MVHGNLRDGDAIVTSHGFIFYVVGYEHPAERYHAILKYVPKKLAGRLDIDWLDIEWEKAGTVLLRPREIYSPEAYARLVESFRRSYPEYLHFSEKIGRWMITVPEGLIDEVYIPSRQLLRMMRRGASGGLEESALELIDLLSSAAGISKGFFGVHGSISLGTSHVGSDIDLSVYGAANFGKAKKALLGLEASGRLTLEKGNRVDRKRLNKGFFRGEGFVVNATRRFSEIKRQPRIYKPMGPVELECRCVSADESVFRPAVYKVTDCKVIGGSGPHLNQVAEVISMVGSHRDIVGPGETMRALGVLEEVVEGSGTVGYRVFVGSALHGEYLDWVGT